MKPENKVMICEETKQKGGRKMIFTKSCTPITQFVKELLSLSLF